MWLAICTIAAQGACDQRTTASVHTNTPACCHNLSFENMKGMPYSLRRAVIFAPTTEQHVGMAASRLCRHGGHASRARKCTRSRVSAHTGARACPLARSAKSRGHLTRTSSRVSVTTSHRYFVAGLSITPWCVIPLGRSASKSAGASRTWRTWRRANYTSPCHLVSPWARSGSSR